MSPTTAWETAGAGTHYVLTLPSEPSFEGKGMRGFSFEPLRHSQIDIQLVDVSRGHDTYMISSCITRMYYVLEGQGYFTIEDRQYEVRRQMLVDVPPNVEYSYTGSMKLLLIGTPRWFRGNERLTRMNPDVYPQGFLARCLARLAFRRRRSK